MQSRNLLFRRGASQNVTVILVVIIVVLIGVIVFLSWSQGNGGNGDGSTDNFTETKKAEEQPPSPTPAQPPAHAHSHPPKPVGDPHRIREVLQQGKTYESTLKVGFQAAVIDAAWGVRETITLVYDTENRIRRTVEKNDGRTIVLLCHVVESRMAELLTDVDVSFDLGQPGFLVLGALDAWLTGGTGTSVAVPAGAVAEVILTESERRLLQQGRAKAQAAVDSLAGKRFRVTYIDGEGLVDLEPVGCTLTQDERDYLEGMSVLGDCYLLPDLESRPGQYWDVDARMLIGLLPPMWRGRPSGTVTIERGQDFTEGGKKYATLQIRSGTFEVNASDKSRRRLGRLTPRGNLYYNITDGYVSLAELEARASLEEVSTDHWFFETRFETAPVLQIQYTCRRLNGPVGSEN